MLIMNKNEFVLFVVEVIHLSAQTERKTGKVKIIIKAAEKYIGVKGLSWEVVEEMLMLNVDLHARSLIVNGQEFKNFVSDLSDKPHVILYVCRKQGWTNNRDSIS